MNQRLAAVGRAVLPVVAALVVGGLMLLALGRDPVAFYANIVTWALLNGIGLQDTITRMAPLLILCAALIVAFRAGIWNLGVDGQFLLGAVLCAAAAAAMIAVLPQWLTLVLAAALAAVVGAVWSLIPALLKAWHGVNEIVTTLMMTFLGVSLANTLVKLPFNDPDTTFPQTRMLEVADRLPKLDVFGMKIHIGVFIALALVLAVHFMMTRTAFGLKLRVVGTNPRAAAHAGLDVPLLTLAVFAISAALAGFAGATEILGVWGLVQQEWNPAYGLTVVPLVFLARFNGFAVIAFVFFFAMLSIGGESASRKADLPNFVVLALVALILIFMALTEYLDARRLARRVEA